MENKIYLAGILDNSNSNGPGTRKVFFSQGCTHHCPACFNKHTWDFKGGKLCDCDRLIAQTIDETYLAGVTFSGGDPVQQAHPFSYLAQKFHQNNVNIWMYTGYTWDELLSLMAKDNDVDLLVRHVDVIVDGPFVQKLHDPELLYRGSSNQRLIKVQDSLEQKRIILWQEE